MAQKPKTKSKTRRTRRTAAKKSPIKHHRISYEPDATGDLAFNRADLIFEGVDHSQGSYEVRVFLNNRKADETTPRSDETGYAGRFVVFGHGACFGDEGHCDNTLALAGNSIYPAGVRTLPTKGQTKVLTVTNALRRIIEEKGTALKSVTVVPVLKSPIREKCGTLTDLFSCESISLHTYR